MIRVVLKNVGESGGNEAINLKHLHAILFVAGNFCRFLNRMVIIGNMNVRKMNLDRIM